MFFSNEELPVSVRKTVPFEEGMTIFRNAFNEYCGKHTDLASYVAAYRALEAAGYVQDGGVFKQQPGLGDVHVNRPMGSDKKKPEDKDDPGTQEPDLEDIEPFTPEKDKCSFTKRISGSSDISLSTEGQKQADGVGKCLADKGGLDVLHSSPLPRATETADAIVAAAPKDSIAVAEPDPALQPWHLGNIEGRDPSEVMDLIKHFIEHPDEVPPGKGADGKPGESFNDATKRQLGCLKQIYADYTENPTMKIGAVMHSRVMELLKAWVDEDCPDDYSKLDTKDLLDPDDPNHSTVLRWNKDKIKDIDLEDDDPLKPGIYLIMHGLTDDDSDKGNKDVEKKFGVVQTEPPNLRPSEGDKRCGTCEYFDYCGKCRMFTGFPVNSMQVCDEYVLGQMGATGNIAKNAAATLWLPPVELHRAAHEAYEAGMAVADITEHLAKGEGLSIDAVRRIDEYFSDALAATARPITRKAWGGDRAQRWASRILHKIGIHGNAYIVLRKCDLNTPLLLRLLEFARENELSDIDLHRIAERIESSKKETLGMDDYAALVTGIKATPVEKAGNGTLLAFWPDAETQTLFAQEGGEKADDLHITLCYLGKDCEDAQVQMLQQLLQSFACAQVPLQATIGGIGRFPATPQSDGQDVIYAGVHSENIQTFRKQLADMVTAAGLMPASNFSYTPHMTLKYVAPHSPGLVNTPDVVPVVFDRIVLSHGGKKTEYPLTGSYSDALANDIALKGTIVKLDGMQQIAFGWFSIVEVEGRAVEDTQEDIIDEPTIENAAYDFVLYARTGGQMHETNGDGEVRGIGRLVESCVFTRQKQKAMVDSLKDQGITATVDLGCIAWWGGMKIDDPATWQRVMTGELRAWSIGGRGKRQKILSKWDPNQPRAENGQFGSGGYEGKGKATTTTKTVDPFGLFKTGSAKAAIASKLHDGEFHHKDELKQIAVEHGFTSKMASYDQVYYTQKSLGAKYNVEEKGGAIKVNKDQPVGSKPMVSSKPESTSTHQTLHEPGASTKPEGTKPESAKPAGKGKDVIDTRNLSPHEAHQVGMDLNGQWGNTLSAAEKAAFTSYRATGYREINGKLRDNDVMPEHVQSRVAQIDSALSRTSLPAEVTVYRGFGTAGHILENMGPGKVMVDNGFVSTSLQKGTSSLFKGSMSAMAEITLPKGTRAAYISNNKHEYEVLLARGTTFHFVSREGNTVKLRASQPHYGVLKAETVEDHLEGDFVWPSEETGPSDETLSSEQMHDKYGWKDGDVQIQDDFSTLESS